MTTPKIPRERTDARVMVLTDPRDQAAFVNALLNPPAPGQRLRRAIRRYNEAVLQEPRQGRS